MCKQNYLLEWSIDKRDGLINFSNIFFNEEKSRTNEEEAEKLIDDKFKVKKKKKRKLCHSFTDTNISSFL